MLQKWMASALFLLVFSHCTDNESTNSISFKLPPGSLREIAYTDKQDAHWVTRAGGYNNSPWHGLTAAKRGYLEDLFISANGELLPRGDAEVLVTPTSLSRDYPDLGISETWTLLDERRTLLIQMESDKAIHWAVQPAILSGNHPQDFVINTSNHEMNVFLNRLKDVPASYPHLKIWFSQPMTWHDASDPGLSLFTSFLTPKAEYAVSHRLVIAVSLSDEPNALDLEPGWIEKSRSSRAQRIEKRAESTTFRSNLPELDKSIFWAHHSLDALVMKQLGKGIYAGLPWFDDYWGRDAFISFSGAVLVSGQYEDARQILLSFAELQNKDEFDANYGRVPNRAQPDNIIYNTTDGTPWFVRSVWDYFRYSNDYDFLAKMWPAIRRATEGALVNWVNDNGLLRHSDADTWMDAKGPDGPWSPRGDRAIDIQFIWRDQLEITRRLAEINNDMELLQEVKQTLILFDASIEEFRSAESGYLVDHLNKEDSQDLQVRPNVLLVPPLFKETCDWETFKHLGPQLVTTRGVLSLAQQDPNFHPFHHLPGLYVQDAAYHNGIIWTWNSAAAITPSVQFHQYHYAESLFNDLTDQILNRGAIGTIAELTDAWPREGTLRLSGTFSQAWSLAEYLRAFYQDILGIQPMLSDSRVKIAPRLLSELHEVKFIHSMGDDKWNVEYKDSGSQFEINISRGSAKPIGLEIDWFTGVGLSKLVLNWEQSDLHLRYEKQMGQWTVPDALGEYFVTSSELSTPPNSLPFCPIDTSLEIPVLKGPKHRLLEEKELMQTGEEWEVLARVSDPQNDDQGLSGGFSYPSNPQFQDGLADILGFQLRESADSYEFQLDFANLVDPGWHPEYGYQLTYCAIGVSYDEGTGVAGVGKNAQAKFQSGFKADQIMYVSGGVLIVDDNYEPWAEYMPRTDQGAIGNAQTNRVRFTLPKDVFHKPLSDALFQIAVGCQDDHGGAGIGDFRPVEAEVGEWQGGGGNASGSNVYDWLVF